MHRVTVVGEVPVGPDGRQSQLVAGKPFAGVTSWTDDSARAEQPVNS
jgi:hypothetical protein